MATHIAPPKRGRGRPPKPKGPGVNNSSKMAGTALVATSNAVVGGSIPVVPGVSPAGKRSRFQAVAFWLH